MKKILYFSTLVLTAISALADAKWLAPDVENPNKVNTWVAFRKDFQVDKIPTTAMAKIAVDSKYWLWINGKMAVFEGGLKRGPNNKDGYYDEVDIAPFLKQGDNKIAMLVWYFGKDGFSHKDSGKFGMFFELNDDTIKLESNENWFSRIHPAYDMCGEPMPNRRLSESNLRFDANKNLPADWIVADAEKMHFKKSKEIGKWGDAPWNNHQKRPIPMWKLFDVKCADFEFIPEENSDLIIARLPYNMQMTPIITLNDAKGGNKVVIKTDHSYAASEKNLRAEYITKKGVQTYESLGWLNGQKIILEVPKDVKILNVQYRESGYNTELLGKFYCDDEFYMEFWRKAMRTLYVNMRDTYFDCPERERAQWWGDTVILMGQSFYTYSNSINLLTRKAIRELVAWAKPNGVLYAPIPAGSWDRELPGQILASVGKYGFWNYYINTGDIETIRYAYPAVKKYLSTWNFDETGLPIYPRKGWVWGDWGSNKDMKLIFAGFYHIALEGAANMADLLGMQDDALEYRKCMDKVKNAYNKNWNGKYYRHPSYKGKTDDRVQTLAVLAGIADESQYEAIFDFLKNNEHASPYMEKYVMESLFKMGKGEYALERAKKRFSTMVNDKRYSTLFEGWEVGTFGGGSTNHAWSGGPIIVLSQYVCGLYPLEAGWKTFKVEPTPASMKKVSISVPSLAGKIDSAFEVKADGEFVLDITVPKGATAIVYMPDFTKDKNITINSEDSALEKYSARKFSHKNKRSFALPSGDYKIVAK